MEILPVFKVLGQEEPSLESYLWTTRLGLVLSDDPTGSLASLC